ncbi:MAG: EVE domain-containing protein [Candidatus Lambdaproteobacteria bacterium]|nr:EVE domain-containing protein [Candidatus Lambdaproteobacteria bacterium]
MKHWLFKTEPSEFSIDDLRRSPQGTAPWDGIRNYQARNLIRDEMAEGDRVLIYHSSSDPTGVAGTARIARAAYPDHTAWDPKSDYYDSRSKPEAPTWFMVDVRFEERFAGLLTLVAMREIPALREMIVLRKGMRLSVQPVTAAEFEAVVRHARALGKAAGG